MKRSRFTEERIIGILREQEPELLASVVVQGSPNSSVKRRDALFDQIEKEGLCEFLLRDHRHELASRWRASELQIVGFLKQPVSIVDGGFEHDDAPDHDALRRVPIPRECQAQGSGGTAFDSKAN